MRSSCSGASDNFAPHRPSSTLLAFVLVPLTILAACHDATRPHVADLAVSVQTSGGDLDTDGYKLVVDNVAVSTLGPDESVTVPGIATGQHHLRLDGVAPNCQVEAPHPRDVTVRPGGLTVQFVVQCETTGISVSVNESGDDPGPDGYAVTLDGGPSWRIYPNATLLFNRLSPGSHTVTLDPAATNCTVQGGRSTIVSVSNRGVTSVAFDVACEAITGTIQVNVSTTGVDPDPNGYMVRIDGSAVDHVDNGASLLITKVTPGAHTVELDDVSGNCTVVEGTSQGSYANVGEVTAVSFTVTCAAAEKISFTRWGYYSSDIMVGFADGSGTAWFASGAQAAWSPDGHQVVVSRQFCYYYSCNALGLFLVERNGAELRRLTTGDDYDPAWSPDGQRIAFIRSDGSGNHLWIMNADGTGPTKVSIDGFSGIVSHPSWSPDASQIALTCGVGNGQEVCLVNPDGSGFVELTQVPTPAYNPSWSPDGAHIAFSQSGKIAVMDLEGSDIRVLATGETPAWSPDGTRIAFHSYGDLRGIYVMNADGTGLAAVTTNAADAYPAWRP